VTARTPSRLRATDRNREGGFQVGGRDVGYGDPLPQGDIDRLCLAVSQEAYDKYHKALKPDGILIIDPFYVLRTEAGEKAIPLAFAQTARDKLGREVVANVIACGAIAEITRRVTLTSLEKSLYGRVPKGTEEKNRQALALGAELARTWKRTCAESRGDGATCMKRRDAGTPANAS